MNSLYNSLMGGRVNTGIQNSSQNQNIENAKSIFNMLSGSRNPYQLLMGIAAKNPMVKNVIDSANNSGKSYKDMF